LRDGFTLSLPPGLIDPDKLVTITSEDGSTLPPWLSYDPVAQNFTAFDVPAGIQALNLVISQGNQTWLIKIAATSQSKAT
jgi:hypothetical protein